MRVAFKHKAGCDQTFTSERGEQHGVIGTLCCECGRLLAYMVPLKEGIHVVPRPA